MGREGEGWEEKGKEKSGRLRNMRDKRDVGNVRS